jgi:plasmid stabilization system protein ParE
LQSRSPGGAARVREAILDSLRILPQFPYAGRPQHIEGVRKLVTRKYFYLIYYPVDVAADEIGIITIQHPAREREFTDV